MVLFFSVVNMYTSDIDGISQVCFFIIFNTENVPALQPTIVKNA